MDRGAHAVAAATRDTALYPSFQGHSLCAECSGSGLPMGGVLPRYIRRCIPHRTGLQRACRLCSPYARVARPARSPRRVAKLPAFEDLPLKIRRAYGENPGLRLSASGQLTRHMLAAILEQRVTQPEAFDALRWIIMRYGESAPFSAIRHSLLICGCTLLLRF